MLIVCKIVTFFGQLLLICLLYSRHVGVKVGAAKLCADYESRVPQHLFHIYVLYTFDNISAHREICNMHCTLTTIRFSLLIIRPWKPTDFHV